MRVRLLREGAQDYLTKPFSVQELGARVGNLVAHKPAEQATRRAEAKYRGIISTSADAIISIDEQHRITEWNRGAEQMFGVLAGPRRSGRRSRASCRSGTARRTASTSRSIIAGPAHSRGWTTGRAAGCARPARSSRSARRSRLDA